MTIHTVDKKRVLLVGCGRRAKEGLIPAFSCLRDYFEISGIVARSKRTLTLFHDQFRFETSSNFESVDFKKIDVICVAVPLSAVKEVLKKLAGFDTKHITLFLDTPVLAPQHLGAVRFFDNFKRVLTLEDSIALPPLVLARQLIDEGKIGRLKKIYFFHSGYRYHALASLKFLTGEKTVRLVRTRYLSKAADATEYNFSFGRRVAAQVLDPRDYSVGRFLIVGEKGVIADYELKGDTVARIGYVMEGDNYRGLTLNGEKIAPDELDKLFLKYISDDLFKKSLMNSLKIRGLITLFMNWDKANSPFVYEATGGLYDALAIMVSEKFGVFWDLGRGKRSLFKMAVSVISRVCPR